MGRPRHAFGESDSLCSAVYGILIENDRVLLLPQEDGAWRLPGGTVPVGETPAQTVRQLSWLAAGFIPEVGSLVFVEDQNCPEEEPVCFSVALFFVLRRPRAAYMMIDADAPAHPEWVSLSLLRREQLQGGWDAIQAARTWLRLP